MKKIQAKRWPTIYTFIVVFIIVWCLFGLGLWLYSNHVLDFQAYQPGQLPGNSRVTSHQVSITRGEGEYFKTVVYNTSPNSLSILEEKSSAQDYALRSSSCSQKLENSTCVTYQTPHHQPYSIQTIFESHDTSAATDQTVSWLKGNTYVQISLAKNQINKYSKQTWDNTVDSFTAMNYQHEHIKRYFLTGG